jgi:hypothetical protein
MLVGWMTETLCLLPKPTMAIECLCFDQKDCDVHIDDGGNLVCRHGSNEGIVDGIAKVICPLEIDSERIKWEDFLEKERNEKANAKKTKPNS